MAKVQLERIADLEMQVEKLNGEMGRIVTIFVQRTNLTQALEDIDETFYSKKATLFVVGVAFGTSLLAQSIIAGWS